MNTFDISKLYIKIAESEVLFEKHIMALNREMFIIEDQDNYTIKFNRIFFDFMRLTFNCLDGLYMDGKFILIDTIKKHQ